MSGSKIRKVSRAKGPPNSVVITSGFYCVIVLFVVISVLSIFISASGLFNSSILALATFPEWLVPHITGHKAEEMSIQYDTLIERAHILAAKYKNITDLHPHLVEHTNTLLDLEKLSKMSKSAAKSSSTTSAIAGKDSHAQKLGGLAAPHSREKATLNKNVIVGIAQDIDPKNFAVFCGSLRDQMKDSSTDAVIFINSPLPKRIKEIGARYNVKIVEFDKATEFDPSTQKYHPSSLRWRLFHKYFNASSVRHQYDHVLMIDVRDSYFQKNPFVEIVSRSVTTGTSYFYAFQGVESMTISEDGWNGGWIRDCFESHVLSHIGSQAIICSGVSLGSMEVVYQYLTLMNDMISGQPNRDLESKGFKTKFPGCERNGVDQGVHNVIIHNNLIPFIKIYSQTNGLVANMQAHMARIDKDIVFNPTGKQSAIVHQYDRYPSLQIRLFHKYVYWLDSTDNNAIWNDEPACSRFSYEENVDLFKGICDMKMHGGASAAATCCQVCSAMSGCEAFTFYNGACFLKSCGRGGRSNAKAELSGAITGYLS